ncbi:MAG: hypothetical protein PHU42_04145 [Patescibacteria group bacterium]|nr:hypothetical protein [Patescibacteria group bacterium]
MKKTILIITLVIIVAGISGGGVYLWQKSVNRKNPTQNANNIVEKSSQENCSINQNNALCLPEDLKLSQNILGSKTFKSERYGIEFNVPATYNVSVNHDFLSNDVVSFSTDNNQYGFGSIKFSIKYNPTFADPLDQAKQAYQTCLTDLEKNGGVGYGCFDNTKSWQKIAIDDKSYGYKAGIGGDPMLMVSFYAISSLLGPKGSTFQFDAYLPSFDTSKNTEQISIEQLALRDSNVKKFLEDFDQIIKSIKFFGK